MSEHTDKKKDLPDKTIQKGQASADIKQKDEISATTVEKQVNQQQPTPQYDGKKSQKASKVEPPSAKNKQENSGFFGISGARSRSPSPQPAVSAVTGKVLGFGSSFFSSATNLISSAVQDEPSTTQPTSRKDSSVSQSFTRSSTPPSSPRKHLGATQTTIPKVDSQKKQTDIIKSQTVKNIEKIPEVTKQRGTEPLISDESKPEQSKVKESSHILPENCPLCKVEIKNDPSNYNTCTDCKSIVCVQCGFNPAPHKTEVRGIYIYIVMFK